MSDPTDYVCIRTGTARKAGLQSTGSLSYAILRDAQATEAYFIVTGNSSAGYYSREAVPLARIEQCLADLPPESPIAAKALRPAFRGKSANDGGFLLALLRHEGLLAPAADASNLNVRSGDWSAWREGVLAEPGEPFDLPTKQVQTTMKANAAATSAAPSITNASTVPHKGKKPRKDRDPERTHPATTEDNHEASD